MIIDQEKSCKPFFSIIMPCYNSESYVDGAVQSIIGQTYDNWKLFYSEIKKNKPEKITDQTKYYLDYYYDLAWKYATMIKGRNRHDFKFLKKHTRFIFLLMRKYSISIGNSFFERFANYFYLLFPDINKNIFETRRDYNNAK